MDRINCIQNGAIPQSPPHRLKTMVYRPDIDGLRAVAIILVVLFHAFPGIMPGGFTGVDIFFVISGYLISGVIISRLEAGTFGFGNFYARRILRIFPALVLLLAASLCAGAFLLKPDEFMALGKHVLAGATFASNIVLYTETGYFDAASHAKPLLNLWSLGVEEQFYIIFPLLVWLCKKHINRLAFVFLVFFLLSFIINIHLHAIRPMAAFYLPHSRFWELLAGAILQAATHGSRSGHEESETVAKIFAHAGTKAAICGFGLLLAGILVCKNNTGGYPGFEALLPVSGAFLIIAAGERNPVNRLLLANPASIFLGKISYTFYLWHWPLLSFAFILLGGHAYEADVALRAGLVAVALILAALTFLLVEEPIRHGQLFGKYKIPVLIAGMCLVGLCGLVFWMSKGFAPFLGDRSKDVYAQLTPPPMKDPAGLAYAGVKAGDLELCRFNNVNAKETVAIIGDSHAQSAYPGLAKLGEKMGFNTALLGRFPIWTHYNDNTSHPARILDILAHKKDIKNVLLIIRGNTYMAKEHNPGHHKLDKLPRMNPEDLYQEIEDFLKKITALGKKVIVVEDNPDLDIDVREAICPGIRRNPIKEDYPRTSRADALARQAQYMAMLDRIAAIPGVFALRGTMDAFCPNGTCEIFTANGLPLYYDDDHLSQAGSQKLAEEVIRPFLEGELAKKQGERSTGDLVR